MVISRRRFVENGKEMYRTNKAREGRAKVFFLFIKYAKFVGLSLPSRRISNSLIIPLALVGYEMIIANTALRASLALYHLISNVRSWKNC